MAGFKKTRGAGRHSDQPQWEPDLRRILDGRPFSLKDIDDSELERFQVPCPGPIRLKTSRQSDAEAALPAGERLYPAGAWSVVVNADNVPVLAHREFTTRLGMWQFKRAPESDAREQFARERRDLA